VLVTPLESSARLQSGGSGDGQVTALFFLDPVDGAVNKGRFRQITFPRADVAPDFSFRYGEHDYAPKFSPNGVGVAYVRSFQNISLDRGGQDPNIQSLRILNLNTGADTEVLQLPQGGYVTSLDWSADGTALVFDFGQQERNANGQLQQSALPQTNEIYVVNLDGTGVRRLRGAGATTPAWKPLAATPTFINALADTFVVGADASRSTNFGDCHRDTNQAHVQRGRRSRTPRVPQVRPHKRRFCLERTPAPLRTPLRSVARQRAVADTESHQHRMG
jgi:Tol biopolymer transport system component